ncbi:MAG TPA: 6-bladed beta-propeller [Halalkalibaculum sp.]|nr:6-bladed beta-propeller [Balneolaceae bacterium]HKL17568.1 6-bladed beta-propeller [Halalkalibaculum sp.]
MSRLKILAILCVVSILIGCASEVNDDERYYQEHSIEDFSVFLSVEENPFLGRPTAIKASPGGLYIIDSGRYKIHKVDSTGDLQMSFGSLGQGPGEYQTITGFWPLGDRYLLYDYNSFKFITYDLNGDMIDEVILTKNPVNPESGRSIPITVEALPSGKLLIPTGGSEGSLFAITEPDGGEVIYAGNALDEFVTIYNHEQVTETYSRGENPGIFKNLVMLGSSSDGIYSLQQTTGVLEKFTHSGERVWELELNIPGQMGLMYQIAQHNIEAGRSNGPTQMFMYALAMDTTEEGVAILLNMPENQPTTIAWVPEEGRNVDLITIESLDPDELGFMEMFALSAENRTAYYLERETGTVYKFDWPL